MPIFEIVLDGPPVSLNAKEGTPRSQHRYRRWVNAVQAEAQKAWPAGVDPTQNNAVAVTVSCYHTKELPDVDNILKPICDGMKEVVYKDDKQIWRVVSQRYGLAAHPVENASATLASALGKWAEIVHIRVVWDEGD